MYLNTFVKTIALLSFSIAPVVTAIRKTTPKATPKGPINPEPLAYHRLTNDLPARPKRLTWSSNYRLKMNDLGDVSGQFWRFAPYAGGYLVSTLFLGPDKCLDAINDNGVASTSVHLANKEAGVPGQRWFLSFWEDGSYRLTNKFTGPTKHLDVYINTKEIFLGTGDQSGQHWHLTEVWR